MSIGYTVIVLLALGHIGAKAEIRVYFEDLSIETIDSTYFDAEKTVAFITDDNTITSNLTVVKKLPPETEGRFKLVGMSMGDYTMPTGFDISMGLCEMLDEPIIVGPFLAVLGFSSDACPPEPGIYFQEGYTLPMENLPDDFPENKYLAVFAISLKQKPLLSVNIYTEVQT